MTTHPHPHVSRIQATDGSPHPPERPQAGPLSGTGVTATFCLRLWQSRPRTTPGTAIRPDHTGHEAGQSHIQRQTLARASLAGRPTNASSGCWGQRPAVHFSITPSDRPPVCPPAHLSIHRNSSIHLPLHPSPVLLPVHRLLPPSGAASPCRAPHPHGAHDRPLFHCGHSRYTCACESRKAGNQPRRPPAGDGWQAPRGHGAAD